MSSRLRKVMLAASLLVSTWSLSGCSPAEGDGGKMPSSPTSGGGMDGAMDKGKMDGGAMDKGKMDGPMDKGKMEGSK